MPPAGVCIISPDIIDLAVMAGVLSGKYPVVAARDYEEALRLMGSRRICRLAYYEVGEDADAAVADMYALSRRGMEVVALFHPPCPTVVRQATAKGRIQGLCPLPILPESLLAQTRETLCRIPPAPTPHNQEPCILTQEEIDFLRDPIVLSPRFEE
ncbi:conserved hypothetical protein [Solidesulfovibrio fructosivorans JJ]]|uniref:Response regulator receiver protein n=1 Tax=Solidesulfovibrio fructosivorans JJ] TaxID=596151 RepID=E1JX69_SOLFR|nr:hypothetical protein [Solidesulfovibrio fructosivorans]EFL51034.1 conserved hypothetical protein [Solidesulfovibrio fructosivorans JJ]]